MQKGRWIVHCFEAGAALLAFGLFRVLPVEVASWLGGTLLRLIGPQLEVSQVARRNLKAVFPDKPAVEIETIVCRMWDNLGRTIGELPHIATLIRDPDRVQVDRPDIIATLRDDGQPGIVFSAHLGNWEVATVLGPRYGLPLAVFYRAPNNPLVRPLYRRIHGAGGAHLLAKGSGGAREALKILQRGGHLGILVDQKMSDGIQIPFLGREAMIAPALAQFAYRYGCPVVPSRVIRLGGARFRFVIQPPLTLPATGDRQADVVETMRRVNAFIETWIRDTPEQWLWIHRRWPE